MKVTFAKSWSAKRRGLDKGAPKNILTFNHKHYFMSPLLITCCVLFLAAFCVLAYVIEHCSFWKSTGPRRWGWIQSWGWKVSNPVKDRAASSDEWCKGWERFMANLEEETKKARADRFAAAEALSKIKNEKFPQHIIDRVKGDSVPEHIIQNRRHARDLYNDGWRCGAGIDQSGRRILFRGEGTAYVSLDVWCEVERLTKAKWDELHGRNYGYGSGSGFEPKDRQFIPYLWPKKDTEVTKERTQVTEVPDKFKDIKFEYGVEDKKLSEYPGYEITKDFQLREPKWIEDGKIAGMRCFRADDGSFKFTMDVDSVSDQIIKYQNKDARRGRRFLPSVNPLGDTGAFRRTIYYDPIFPPMWLKYADRVSFRHKKGGKRG